MHIAIIGAGAAGIFTAINLKEMTPSVRISVYESASRPLAKLGITGGGRCNLTNSFEAIKQLSEAYPRGEKLMKRIFHRFDHKRTYQWFETHGIRLVTQPDGCVFPRSQNAGEIVGMMLHRANELGIKIHTRHRVNTITHLEIEETIEGKKHGYRLTFSSPSINSVQADAVVVTSGGSPKISGLSMLAPLSPTIIEPIPSLFSFNIADSALTSLMGTVVEPVMAGIAGTKHRAMGALLITHWGMSGPAILKLSSYAARHLHDCNYQTRFFINWYGDLSEADILRDLHALAESNRNKQIGNTHPEQLPSRLWHYLLKKIDINPETKWCDIGKKGFNRLLNTLSNDSYTTTGKNRFKDEFVTCGGVALCDIRPDTMESRTHNGLFFAGEVLDIDAITGGFNLQAAWSTAYIVAETLSLRQKNQTFEIDSNE